MTDTDYEALVILLEFMRGSTIRGLARKFKKPVGEIELILRTKPTEVAKWQPVARRK
jgi:Holliday junction resolvase-like predicted endonuclease